MTTALDRGAFSGRESKLYYNSGSHDAATWVEILRARNIQFVDGPTLQEVFMHGSVRGGNIPGYKSFSGSFEYVKKRKTDSVLAALETIQRAGDIVEIEFVDQDRATSGAKKVMVPLVLGQFEETRNGNDEVVISIPFGRADCHDSAGAEVDVTYSTTA